MAENVYRKKTKIFSGIVRVVSVALCLFQMYAGGISNISSMTLRTIHWTVISAVAIVSYPAVKGKETMRWYDYILLAASLFATIYVAVVWPTRTIQVSTNDPLFSTLDKVAFLVMTLVILEIARRTTGLALTVTAAIALIYLMFLGPYMPGIFRHRGYSLSRVAPFLLFSSEGVYGSALGTSASFIMLFVLFGDMLEAAGAGKFFIDIAYGIAGRFRGGPAKTAVVSSALMGCVSGSSIANVVTTGTFTIPLMVSSGYKKNSACAIEAVASTGGMIMPPMMGAAAFILAEYVGVSYGEVCWAAILPAVLYYLGLFLCVDKEAAANGLVGQKKEDLPKPLAILKQKGYLLLPLVILIYCLVRSFSPQKTVFWTILILIAISYLRKESRITPRKACEAKKSAVKGMAPVAAACAAAGLIVGAINLTGVGVNFTSSITRLSGGSPFVALLMTAIAALILGMGLPPVAVYIVVSTVVAPALTQMGFSLFASHLFVFYFDIIGAITPPVALTAYAAAGLIEGASAFKVGVRAFLYGIVAFIVPFVFMYDEAFLLSGTPGHVILAVVTAILALDFISAMLIGYFTTRINWFGRIVCLLVGILLFLPNTYTSLVGIVLAGVMFFLGKKKRLTIFEAKEVGGN